MITRISSVIRPEGFLVSFDHPYTPILCADRSRAVAAGGAGRVKVCRVEDVWAWCWWFSSSFRA
jgi:hypothetical protein